MSENSVWYEEEKKAAYYLSNISGIGKKSLFRLLEQAGSAVEILRMSESSVYEVLDKKTAGIFLKHRNDRTNVLHPDFLKKEKGIDYISYTLPDFPARLRNIPDPPFGIFVKGKLPSEDKPSVAIIGARACSEYGKNMAKYFGRRLGAAGIQIISGMARGIDGIAQSGALEGGGESYAVLGCGADICYPEENKGLYEELPKRGGIISEYLPGTGARSSLFPPRNRIISGLSDLLLVIEARKKSGTYITVMQALEQGKEVFAVPGRIVDTLSDGCNYLLTQGAGVAVGPEVIIEELLKRNYTKNMLKSSHGYSEATLQAEEKVNDTVGSKILSCLDITPVSIDEIYTKLTDSCRISMAELLLELTKLQIQGKIIGEGNYYRLTYAL